MQAGRCDVGASAERANSYQLVQCGVRVKKFGQKQSGRASSQEVGLPRRCEVRKERSSSALPGGARVSDSDSEVRSHSNKGEG
jgi:hypothetical protein